MFVDFNQVFGQKQTELPIPNVLVDYLSSKLSGGLRYEKSPDGRTIFITSDDNITFSGFELIPTQEQIDILGENYSIEELLFLSYNSQKPIAFHLLDGKNLIINNNKIPIEEVQFNPLKPTQIDANSMRIIPSTFDDSFESIIGTQYNYRKITFTRVPNNSKDVISLISDKNSSLSIECHINNVTKSMRMNMQVCSAKAKSVDDIINSLEIYIAFLNGEGSIGKTPLNSIQGDCVNEIESANKGLAFWKKIKQIESILNTVFEPPFDDIDNDSIYIIEELFQSLKNQKPTKMKNSLYSVTSHWDVRKGKTVKDQIGKPVCFFFRGAMNITIFNQSYKFYFGVGVFNCILSKYEVNGEEGTVYFDNENEEKRLFSSRLSFISEAALEEFIENNKDYLKTLYFAKPYNEIE